MIRPIVDSVRYKNTYFEKIFKNSVSLPLDAQTSQKLYQSTCLIETKKFVSNCKALSLHTKKLVSKNSNFWPTIHDIWSNKPSYGTHRSWAIFFQDSFENFIIHERGDLSSPVHLKPVLTRQTKWKLQCARAVKWMLYSDSTFNLTLGKKMPSNCIRTRPNLLHDPWITISTIQTLDRTRLKTSVFLP